jgi:hypothetical protein
MVSTAVCYDNDMEENTASHDPTYNNYSENVSISYHFSIEQTSSPVL